MERDEDEPRIAGYTLRLVLQNLRNYGALALSHKTMTGTVHLNHRLIEAYGRGVVLERERALHGRSQDLRIRGLEV